MHYYNRNQWNHYIPVIFMLSIVLVLVCVSPQTLAAGPENSNQSIPQMTYEVDPNWPNRPEYISWGAMPGIAIDKEDQVWLYTRAKPPIQKYYPNGRFIKSWGDDIIGEAHYIKIDKNGNVWVADIGRHVVLQFTAEGRLLKTLGTPGRAGRDENHLNKPTDMAITQGGDVFVSDGYGNDRIVHFDKNGKFVKEWGRTGTGPGEFNLPHAIVVDSKGILYVADRSNGRVQVFDQSGKFLSQWQNLIVPWGIFITAKDELWICGSSPMEKYMSKYWELPPKDQIVMKFDRKGNPLSVWTLPMGLGKTAQPGEVNWLHSVAIDSKNNFYLGDIRGQRAQKFIKHR